jgi:Tfp pilus assembly protein PilN
MMGLRTDEQMSMIGVNLIPHRRRHAAAARHRARRWCWAVAGYAAALLAGYVFCAAVVTMRSDDKGALLDKTNRQIEDLNHATASLTPQLAEAHTKLSVARTVGDQPDWSLLLAIISSTIDDDIVLSSTKLEPAADDAPVPRGQPLKSNESAPQPAMLRLSLQGLGRSQAAVTQFVLRLERLGLFERIDLAKSARQNVGNADANVFRIECLLQRSGKRTSAGGASR